MSTDADIAAAPDRSERFYFLATLALAVLVFAAIAPTLSSLEFSGGMENLNIATALEIRRDGNWLMPTLEGAPRVSKPPLAAWITASAIRSSTLMDLPRPEAYARLAFETRASALLISCITIIAVYFLGQTLASPRVGFFAAAIFASSYAFLRFGRQAITDVHLTLWVTVANVLLAKAIFDTKFRAKSISAGVAIGLAILSKGPVALVATIVPLACYLAWRRMPKWKPLVTSAAVSIVVAAPWFILVALRAPGVSSRWTTEVTRVGATENASGNPLFYFVAVALLMPWVVPLGAGIVGGIVDIARRSDKRIVLAIFMLIVPLIVMSFFPDRKDRYALPMIPSAAVIAAGALDDWLRKRGRAEKIALGAHWMVVAIIAVGFPLAAALFLRTQSGAPWLDWPAASAAAAVMFALMWGARGFAGVGITVIAMLIAQFIFMHGYARTQQGRSEMKPLAEAIVAAYPDAIVYNGRRDDKRVPVDLAIYMNRATVRDENWSTLPRGDRPRVVVLQQRPDEADPSPPAGWRFLAKSRRDRDWWWAFVQVD